jgi:hypothetical protein
MKRLRVSAATASVLCLMTASFSIGADAARSGSPGGGGGGGGVTPFASGQQVISSGPGVYAQTSTEYSSSWGWSQDSGPYDYYWYLFTAGGSLQANGHKATGGGDDWSGAANNYYFKEYNNEPVGSGRINVLSVNYCC